MNRILMNRVSGLTRSVRMLQKSSTVPMASRMAYSTLNTKKQQINKLMQKIGDENSQESQKTMKVIRTIGAGSIIVVLCSLLWASSMSTPVKETYVEIPDLSKDVRDQ